MYNRYIPQPDGSYKRKLVQDKRPPVRTQYVNPEHSSDSKEEPHTQEEEKTQANRNRHTPSRQQMHPQSRRESQKLPFTEVNAGTFLRNLIPKNLDTGDLLIIVLLLLMSGESREEQNNALLTLAIYLFL